MSLKEHWKLTEKQLKFWNSNGVIFILNKFWQHFKLTFTWGHQKYFWPIYTYWMSFFLYYALRIYVIGIAYVVYLQYLYNAFFIIGGLLCFYYAWKGKASITFQYGLYLFFSAFFSSTVIFFMALVFSFFAFQ